MWSVRGELRDTWHLCAEITQLESSEPNDRRRNGNCVRKTKSRKPVKEDQIIIKIL